MKAIKHVLIIIRDKNGNVIDTRKTEEIMTVASRNYTARLWGGGGIQQYYIELGIGSGTPADTDTDLFTPVVVSGVYIARKGVSPSVSNNTVTFWARYLPEEANGYTYTEIGLFLDGSGDGSSRGTMLEHGTFTGITKTSNILLDVYITITFI